MAIRFDGRITGPGDLSKYTEAVACAEDRLQCVPDPLGQRGYVLRARRQADDTTARNGYRAEVYTTGYKRVPPFVEWYEWESLFLRSEFAQGWPNPMIFFQIHDDWSGGGTPHLPPIEMGVHESSMYVLANAALTQAPATAGEIIVTECVSAVPIVWDRWARVVMRADYRTDGTGSIDIWYDGKRACAMRNVYNCYPSNANLVQTGAYSGLDQLRNGVTAKNVYSTGVRIYDDATTHAEMGVSADIPLVSSGSF